MGLVSFGGSSVHFFDWQSEQLPQTLILIALHQLFKELSMMSDIANESYFHTTIILIYKQGETV